MTSCRKPRMCNCESIIPMTLDYACSGRDFYECHNCGREASFPTEWQEMPAPPRQAFAEFVDFADAVFQANGLPPMTAQQRDIARRMQHGPPQDGWHPLPGPFPPFGPDKEETIEVLVLDARGKMMVAQAHDPFDDECPWTWRDTSCCGQDIEKPVAWKMLPCKPEGL